MIKEGLDSFMRTTLQPQRYEIKSTKKRDKKDYHKA